MASSSSSTPEWKYDVFLSFRGLDTRKNFVSHLYSALCSKGIFTFKDDPGIKKGDSITDELIKAIHTSRFAIVVISENYASSPWCLEELQKIMEFQAV
ncbi:Disease resistance protein Roq1 [Cardamine amara subsp. amara]|uniref:Disease resistance protein Roq1 n=1 Tax=Cardamine amara subsp. amara TaxID=228776 RepID=A0ABD0ZF10_CARAN